MTAYVAEGREIAERLERKAIGRAVGHVSPGKPCVYADLVCTADYKLGRVRVRWTRAGEEVTGPQAALCIAARMAARLG